MHETYKSPTKTPESEHTPEQDAPIRPSFCGFFINRQTLQDALSNHQNAIPTHQHLQMECLYPHVTTQYFPDSSKIDDFSARPDLYGEPVQIRVIGYGNDGKNEGLKVAIESENPALVKLSGKKDKTYHITLSYSKDSAPVNTNFIEYIDIPEDDQFYLTGTYNISDSNIIHDSLTNIDFDELDSTSS